MILPTYFTHSTQPLFNRARLSPFSSFAPFFHYEGALSEQQLKEEVAKGEGEGEENNNTSASSLSEPSSFPGLVGLSMDEKEREGLPSGSSSSFSLGQHQGFARNSSSSPGNIDNYNSNCPFSRQELGTLEATTTTNQNEKDEDATSFIYATQHSKLSSTDAIESHICESLASSSLTKTLPPSSTRPVPAHPSTSQLSPLTEYTGSSPFAFSSPTASPSSELPVPLQSSSSSDYEDDGIEKVMGGPIFSDDPVNDAFRCPSVPALPVCPAVSTSSSPSLASSSPVLETAMAMTNSNFAASLTEANENESNFVWTEGRSNEDQNSAIWVDEGSTTSSSKGGVVSSQTRNDFSPTKTENNHNNNSLNNADHLEVEKQKLNKKKQRNSQVSELHQRQWKERSLQLFEAAWVEALRRERSAIWSSKKLNFRVEFDTLFGQNVFLVGSSVFLGEWDLRSAMKMTWTRGNWWTVMVNVSRDLIAEAATRNDGSSVKYKYVVIGPDIHQVEWEPGNDHQFNLHTIKSGTIITDCWGLG